jgi:hypothetical protein
MREPRHAVAKCDTKNLQGVQYRGRLYKKLRRLLELAGGRLVILSRNHEQAIIVELQVQEQEQALLKGA